jgi:hypothetical protein
LAIWRDEIERIGRDRRDSVQDWFAFVRFARAIHVNTGSEGST